MASIQLENNKKKVFQVVLVYTLLASLCFAGINYLREIYVLAYVEIFLSACCLGLVFHIRNVDCQVKYERWVLIFLLLFFSFMMFAVSMDGVSITIFSWVLVIPLLSYLLLGVSKGFFITALFYGVSTFFLLNNFTGHPVMFESAAYANFFACALLFWVVSHGYEHASEAAKEQLKQVASCDHLTGLFNRTQLSQKFNQVIEAASINNTMVSLVAFDLDGFKTINDEFGHDVGDQVLKKFADIIQNAVKDVGYAFRIGGEEFAVVFSVESELMVLSLAENVRRETEHITIEEQGVVKNKVEKSGSSYNVSVSSGVVSTSSSNAQLSDMMITADRRMYQGKNQGRNIVIHKG